jgi:hypothetical protein
MAAVNNFVSDMKRLLRQAIRDKTVVTYSDAWDEFDHVVTLADRLDTIDEASIHICEYEDAICSAVMSKSGNDLPVDRLFDLMREHRLEEYSRIAGDTDVTELTPAQKRELTDSERARVYKHFE